MKKALATALATATYFAYTGAAFAQSLNPCEGSGTSSNIRTNLCAITGSNAGQMIRNIIVIILVVAAVIALFFLIWGGIKWILSGGDKAKVDTARSTIIAALVGLVITFLAYFILSVVLGIFGLNLNDLTLPSINTQS